MGSYYKIYLTSTETEALELLQFKRKEAGENTAANAIFKDALRDHMVQQGVMEQAPAIGSNPPLLRLVKPVVEEQEPEVRPRRRRRVRE